MPSHPTPDHEKLIFALDLPTAHQAHALIERLGNTVSFYKLGLELCMSGDYFSLMASLSSNNKQIFADLKFFDIPQTVANAVKNLAQHEVRFCTVHADPAIIEAAAAHKHHMKILAVTVLTSLSDVDLANMGYRHNVIDTVVQRAKYSIRAGADGVVASAQEAPILREKLGNDFLIVSPGVRLHATHDDQKRTVDIEQAFSLGADYIVVGRPIRDADDPQKTASMIQQRIAAYTAQYSPKKRTHQR